MTPAKPLAGMTAAVTRPRHQSGQLARALEVAGAKIIEFPTIEIRPRFDWPDTGALDRFDWAIFTSANAVTCFAEGLTRRGMDMRQLTGVSVCAVGPSTERALREFGLIPVLVPPKYHAEGILAALGDPAEDLRGKRVLLPQGNIARPLLRESLTALGTDVTAPVVYETVCPEPADGVRDAFVESQPGIVTFTSASTAENFCRILGPDRLKRLRAVYASIGPQTTAAAQDHGLTVTIEPKQHDVPGLVESIIAWRETHGESLD